MTSWRFHNRAWQPRRHDRLPETSGTLWIHRGALTNQRCSLATGCGIKVTYTLYWPYKHPLLHFSDNLHKIHCPTRFVGFEVDMSTKHYMYLWCVSCLALQIETKFYLGNILTPFLDFSDNISAIYNVFSAMMQVFEITMRYPLSNCVPKSPSSWLLCKSVPIEPRYTSSTEHIG